MASFAANALVDNLCALVNLKALNPSSQNTFQLADIASVMDNELNLGIVPLMKATAQEYFVYNVDVPIVSGQTSYTMPPRAIGNSVRDIVLVDASGNEVNLNNLMREYIKISFPFTFIPPLWSLSQFMTANEVNLYNGTIVSFTAYKLRFITERRPGALTLSTNCGLINNISGKILTLNYVDPTWSTSTTFDIINPLPPFQSIADDVVITNINGFQITLSQSLVGIAVGQWLCPAMMSCIPQIPYDLFPLLIERTISSVAEALDMSQLVASANARIQEFEAKSLILMRPRVQGSPRKIVNKNNFRNPFWRNGY